MTDSYLKYAFDCNESRFERSRFASIRTADDSVGTSPLVQRHKATVIVLGVAKTLLWWLPFSLVILWIGVYNTSAGWSLISEDPLRGLLQNAFGVVFAVVGAISTLVAAFGGWVWADIQEWEKVRKEHTARRSLLGERATGADGGGGGGMATARRGSGLDAASRNGT